MRKKENNSFFDPKIKVDPQGSYTGIAEDNKEQPVQDADDL